MFTSVLTLNFLELCSSDTEIRDPFQRLFQNIDTSFRYFYKAFYACETFDGSEF